MSIRLIQYLIAEINIHPDHAKRLKLSEAASLALHSMVLSAVFPGRKVSAREIATELDVSEAHLAKVLQRLARRGRIDWLVRYFAR